MFKCDTCNYTSKRSDHFNRHKHFKHKHIQVTQTAPETAETAANTLKDIFINDYGDERTDYISDEILLNIIKYEKHQAIPAYIQMKYFNADFPENQSIKYENEACHIKINDKWKIIPRDILCDILYYAAKKEISLRLECIKEKIKIEVICNITLDEIDKLHKYLEDEIPA